MADKTGYIGRNPNDSAVTVARQFFTASGVTTAFTFASGYLTGYLDVYVDGVKKRVADEFTATDGSTFDVLQGGVGAGSTVEAVAYKAFNAAAVSGDITGNFDVSGNTTLGGSLGVTGGTTVTNLVVTGISTLGTGTTVGFANTAFNLGGTPNISVDLLSAVDINVSGAATIGGVLTYEDVTNIDSIGIVTARTGIEVTANGLVVNAGVSTLAADLSIADKIVHTSDTNTAIRFPSNDTFTVETSGVERLRIDSTGDVGLVGIATATGLVVVAGSGIYAGHTGVVTAVSFDGSFTGNVTGAASQVTVADESSDTTCFPLFATAATGNLPPKSGSNLTFNSSSGALTATSFAGNITGGTVGGSEATFTSFVTSSRFTVNGALSTNVNGTDYAFAAFDGSSNLYASIDQAGAAFFASDLTIVDKIIHSGDTNTAIRFPAADTFTVETGGTEVLRIDSSQNFLVGATSARSELGSGVQVEGNAGNNLILVRNATGATQASAINIARTRGSSAGDETIVQDGDDLGFINFTGADGTDIASEAAQIRCQVDGTPGSNDMPGRLIFSTTADGASSGTERLRIDSSGHLIHTGLRAGGGENKLAILSTLSHNTNEEKVAVYIAENEGSSNQLTFGGGSSSYNAATTLRFMTASAVDTTAGTERLRIDSSGRLLVSATVEGAPAADNLTLEDSGDCGLTIRAGTSNYSTIYLSDATSGTGEYAGSIQYGHADNSFRIGANSVERVRITSAGNLSLVGDNQKLLIGAGDDLEIYHDGSNSYIKDSGTGRLLVLTSGFRVNNAANNENIIHAEADGAVELYHDNSKKFETTSAGVTVTGTVSDSVGPLRRLNVAGKSSDFTLTAANAGALLRRTGGNATVPADVFTAGDMITIFNAASSGDMTVLSSAVTLINSADGDAGNTRTIASKGMATIVCTASNEFVISGSQLT